MVALAIQGIGHKTMYTVKYDKCSNAKALEPFIPAQRITVQTYPFESYPKHQRTSSVQYNINNQQELLKPPEKTNLITLLKDSHSKNRHKEWRPKDLRVCRSTDKPRFQLLYQKDIDVLRSFFLGQKAAGVSPANQHLKYKKIVGFRTERKSTIQ
mmetsp:Transcript_8856/g.13711  ORF Transcript_8856/g.13711 Transcript_8856/m.13711 type:complete len:155 (+) Transcript_8856:178-642(+)